MVSRGVSRHCMRFSQSAKQLSCKVNTQVSTVLKARSIIPTTGAGLFARYQSIRNNSLSINTTSTLGSTNSPASHTLSLLAYCTQADDDTM